MEQLVAEERGTDPDLNAHAADDQLELYALGKLQASELGRLEEHLLVCEVCRGKLDATAEFAAGMRDAAAGAEKAVAGTSSRLSSLLRRPAVSMTIAFVVVIILIGIFSNGKKPLTSGAPLELPGAGSEIPTVAPARPFDLKLTDGPREGGPFKIEVSSSAGITVWSGLAGSTQSGIEVKVAQQLLPGDYFVRVYSADGKMLLEHAFRVR